MLTVSTPWRDRSVRLARIILWVALLIGVGFDVTRALLIHTDDMISTYGAAAAAMVYVIGVTVVPAQML
ncbi:MAG TPA: hypothetical protein VHM94_02385, partial [Acidimicrobiia bacterium]|nr:hypothetical protein [Acidimicrobiia bacterium]